MIAFIGELKSSKIAHLLDDKAPLSELSRRCYRHNGYIKRILCLLCVFIHRIALPGQNIEYCKFYG